MSVFCRNLIIMILLVQDIKCKNIRRVEEYIVIIIIFTTKKDAKKVGFLEFV